jgi:hypothetical protein
VRAAELEGGVTRNSSPSAIELVRNVFDCFLAKFPLFFGYWKKYADLEFSIGGTETAEMVRTLYTVPAGAIVACRLGATMVLTTETCRLCRRACYSAYIYSRSMNAVCPAYPAPSIFGPITALSRWTPAMIMTLFESKSCLLPWFKSITTPIADSRSTLGNRLRKSRDFPCDIRSPLSRRRVFPQHFWHNSTRV